MKVKPKADQDVVCEGKRYKLKAGKEADVPGAVALYVQRQNATAKTKAPTAKPEPDPPALGAK